jgi:hypothetical protein
MAVSSDFLSGSDLDQLFDIIDGGFLDHDEEFNVELENILSEVPTDHEVTQGYPCDKCKKTYQSSRGLARHNHVKHNSSICSDITEEQQFLQKINPSSLRVIVVKCAEKLGQNLCYPQTLRDRFIDFEFLISDAAELWNKILDVIGKYNGDAEKFYSLFFGLMSDNLLPKHFDDLGVSNTLMQEVANDVLIHLSGKNEEQNLLETKPTIHEKEMRSLEYLAGFVIHKLFKKYRFSKNCNSVFNFQSCSILQACKIETDCNQTLVNARDRGGLWRVNAKMIDLFEQCELLFRSKTSTFITSFSCRNFVNEIMTNTIVTSRFNSVCMSADTPIVKEIQKNVLEQIFTLFVRDVRTFSFAKNTREKYKVSKKASRKRSLRTEIKSSN